MAKCMVQQPKNAWTPELQAVSQIPSAHVPVPSPTRLLSRFVFDELFDEDALGFLLSSSHLYRYLVRLKDKPSTDRFSQRNLDEVTAGALAFETFHTQTLAMFAGAYIKECHLASHSKLMEVLDNKWTSLTGQLPDASITVPCECNKVEAAWKYRNLTSH